MIIEEFKGKVAELKMDLDSTQQKMISLNSIENFLLWYDLLKTYKQQVLDLLIAYFDEIEEYNYNVDKKTSNRLAFDYIMKIGTFYSNELGFKVQMKMQFVLMVGLHIDLVLLLTGILGKMYYFPITTFSLFCRWLYLKINYEKKHMVHNIRF